MSGGWYGRVTADPDDLTPLAECLEYYEAQVIDARKEMELKGRRLEDVHKRIPGITEFRFNQLQELEAILKYMEIKYNKVRGKAYRKYMENYDRALSSRDADKYTDTDDEVLDVALLVNQVALIRNKFLGIIKSLDMLNFQVGHITRLRVAGMDDATL